MTTDKTPRSRLIDGGVGLGGQTYPGRDHGLQEGEGTPYHMRMHMARYLVSHLAPGPE